LKSTEFDKLNIEVIKGDIFMILDSELSFKLNVVRIGVWWGIISTILDSG